jgi:hypothetical protein
LFRRHHGDPHLDLACHAALPLALSPDLAYRLWANFQRDTSGALLGIPWVAVADLLLSPLCEEVGDELYEMDEAVRSVLLERLATDARLGSNRLRRVAAFLDEYVKPQLNSEDIDTRDFAQAQRWAALAYTAPGSAASALARAFAVVPSTDKPEVVRIATVVEALATPLGSFTTLLMYAQAAQSLARGHDHPAIRELRWLAGPDNRIAVAGVSVPVPWSTGTVSPPREAPTRFVREVPVRFAVAFSLAGEQRQLVLPVAQEVEAILGRSTVFYDDWYEHWIAGLDADLLLQRLYGEMAEVVVVCVSGAYRDKPWNRTELRAVRTRLMQASRAEDRNRIFPVRVGDGEVEGVPLNEIVPDLRLKTPTEAAELIVARLNLVRGFAGGMERAAARWPSDAPVLQWAMADQGEVRAALARLLCEGSRERALFVRGASETGKSHISKLIIRNAMLLPGVVAGRFDFKGTTNMGVEIEAFARPLGIEPPGGHTLNERLAGIFRELRRRARPTLLVFDTYEAAGEAKDWIEGVLLAHLVSTRWLRVVITGQSVPARAGSTWESVAARTLTLQWPGPEDWLVYGRANRGDTLSLEFVAQVHQMAGGKPSVLASLLGPVS